VSRRRVGIEFDRAFWLDSLDVVGWSANRQPTQADAEID
jgi:hypothetical protein